MKKSLFIVAHTLGDPNFCGYYKQLCNNQWTTRNFQKNQQEKNLKCMIKFATASVPYYSKLFRSLGLSADDIKNIHDLEKIPVLTKEIIRKNWNDLIPTNLKTRNYYNMTTGGTTGQPLRYRISKKERFLAGAILYRGFGYGGYNLGDRMLIIGGSSVFGNKDSYMKKCEYWSRNIDKISAFSLGKSQDHLKQLTRYKPKFLYGYASSLYELSIEFENHKKNIPKIESIFTTSEKLHKHMRCKIEDIFECQVFDTYGANDGGATAFECSEHNGMHIDSERSVLELVSDDGSQVERGEGKILSTSLFNYAMPLIRYSTGDVGTIKDEFCSCGRGSILLDDLVGRSVDMILTPDGEIIHGWFFLYLFWEINKGILQYQVIQHDYQKITIFLVVNDEFEESQLNQISDILRKKCNKWIIEYKFVESIPRTQAGKTKFIINQITSEVARQ
jgi:phenylacetate-CoA ligase